MTDKKILSKNEVKNVLLAKISEEKSNFPENEIDTYLENIVNDPEKFNILSLFSGCGGMDLGFELAGIEASLGAEASNESYLDKKKFLSHSEHSAFYPVYANDLFKEALVSYKTNFPDHVYIHSHDIRKIREFPKANLILGGFPCPGFSEAGPRLVDDPRNFLYLHFIRSIMQVKPEFFVAENVKGMLTLGKGEVFKQIFEDFSAAGYRVKTKLVNARDYGVAQLRERVILVGVRNDLNFEYEFPEPTHGAGAKAYATLENAIGDLSADPGEYFTGSYSSIYLSRNRKKKWDEQSFTIQASGRQAPLHPGGLPMKQLARDRWELQGENRRLSVKEAARIQTFPDWYHFSGGDAEISDNGRLNKIYKQIGNAVPVMLAKAIAKPIARWAVEHRATKK